MSIPTIINIDHGSSIPKYRQIINQIYDALNAGQLKPGQSLPSVNLLIEELKLSRDTVFKAYQELKRSGIIESIPGKGYFIRDSRTKILLFLDKYSPFKEGLYNAMRSDLSENYSIDLYFHHYNIDVFENVLQSGLSRYNFFIVMSIDHPGASAILNNLRRKNVLILDVVHGAPPELPSVYQEFEFAFYSCLEEVKFKLEKYKELVFVLRPETDHPIESAKAFKNFCCANEIKSKVVSSLKVENISRETAYIVVSDDDLVMIVEKARSESMILGKDIGIISYNDTPVKKVIGEGITVISTDFPEMGKQVAKFIKGPFMIRKKIPTRLIMRNSL
ncbi:MAG: GntR family transcriptional regulator [Bacteroidales bacterium]